MDKIVDEKTAFAKWLKQSTHGDIDKAAELMRGMLLDSPSAELIWDYLKKTNDKQYNYNTFVKAAKLALKGGVK